MNSDSDLFNLSVDLKGNKKNEIKLKRRRDNMGLKGVPLQVYKQVYTISNPRELWKILKEEGRTDLFPFVTRENKEPSRKIRPLQV